MVILYASRIEKDCCSVKTNNDADCLTTLVTEWRMTGDVDLPWRPRIELTGQTRFTLDKAKGGRIVDYYEKWVIVIL